jgi:predicted nucleic acid-binding Zn ribbon protein
VRNSFLGGYYTMPIYVFECTKCHKVQNFMLGLSEVIDVQAGDITDLKEFSCCCEDCEGTEFKKLPAAHGKTAVNWGSWYEKRSAK